MEFIILLIVGGIVVIFVLPIMAIVKASNALEKVAKAERATARLQKENARLIERLDLVEFHLGNLLASPPAEAESGFALQEDPGVDDTATSTEPEPVSRPVFELSAPSPVPAAPPPLPAPPPAAKSSDPVMAPPASPTIFAALTKPVNLEQFMGAKLFAWVGGLALFLGVIFFVKLSIERGWISPGLRTAIGFLTGAILVGGGVVMQRRDRYATLAQTLCATGIGVLYGVTFAAHALWRIPPFSHAMAAFALMTLITGAAFLLAVRLSAQVVAVLGMLGGFLTPILCSTGRDDPFGLFSYIALLDIGVLSVAKSKRWLHLTALAAAGTILMQAGWMLKFFQASQYAMGWATLTPMGVFLGFAALFSVAAWWSEQRDDGDLFPSVSALALCGSAMCAAFVFLLHGSITERPLLLHTFVLCINFITLSVVWRQARAAIAQGVIGALTFLHLSIWTTRDLTEELLPHALGMYLAFGLLHIAFAVLMARRAPGQTALAGWVPVLTLVLLLIPVLSLDAMSLMIWPAILIMDLLIIVLAVVSGHLLPVLAALALTLVTAGAWLFRWPGALALDLGSFLIVLGGFAMLFGLAGGWFFRNKRGTAFASLLPVSAAVLPFLLLILATLRLRIADPSPVFGLALLLTLFLLGLVRVSGLTVLAPTALGCVLALEWAWHQQSFTAESAVMPLCWYLGFHAIFTVFPFVFRTRLAARKLPWITSAASGAGVFTLVYRLVGQAWPNDMMGLLPAAFSITPLLCLLIVLRHHGADNPARLTQLAWFGGVALLFITLIFPVQFEKQWITIGWALEGAALCWLYRRVPHTGLPRVGGVLLVISFVRLALNPSVLAYHERGAIPVLNWQLYAFGLTALSMFLAARWLAPPGQYWSRMNLRAVFCSLGGILLFLLLNIEIADAFTPPGERFITFEFGENLARDMTCTIAWAGFALALLVLGIWKRNAPTRYSGLGLLGVALLKLFLYDLANTDSVYRVGALVGVAVIALAASFLYQRFLTGDKS